MSPHVRVIDGELKGMGLQTGGHGLIADLVKTVPPKAVHPDRDILWPAEVAMARANGTRKVPAHDEELTTIYRYNSLNQVVSRHTPDAGLSSYWYDRLGRLAVSRNAEQAQPGSGGTQRYSYTLYDGIGRITEVGQKPQPNAMTSSLSRNPASLSAWLHYNNATFDYDATEVTATVYDLPSGYTKFTEGTGPLSFIQQPHTLRNRVSYTRYYDRLTNDRVTVNGQPVYVPQYQDYAAGTYYAYDIHGNVDTLVQDYQQGTMSEVAYGFKLMAYRYDLISGKVNEVHYQPGAPDEFYHRYDYDAENRLTDVYTTTRKAYIGHTNLEEHEAHYQYYKHGPLARTILGQNQVQGIDYAYTLQGWLKGVNSTAVGDGAHDMGGDGTLTARDAYGFSLNYFNGDYQAIGTVAPFAPVNIGSNLYNGNIKAMVMNIPTLGDALVYKYGYDQLNRLVGMTSYKGINNTSNTFTPISTGGEYQEQITYDPNGNIMTYLRNSTEGSLALNNYNYTYTTGTNRLASIYNSVNMQTKTYSYDEIGNTTVDGMQGVTGAVWNVYGKLKSLTNKDAQSVTYTYSADGQRISKKVGNEEEWYVRDAMGNIMATYKKDASVNGGDLTVTELYKYGSSLLSVRDAGTNVENPLPPDAIVIFERGLDSYILTDGNGNTKVTVSDKKLQHSSNGTTVDYYLADVKTATLHSTFGANAKTYNGGFSQANFNGQRKSLEVGEHSQTAQFWEYNGDVGRRWNVDPRPDVSLSPYGVFGGNPILFRDVLGDTIGIGNKNEAVQYRQGKIYKYNEDGSLSSEEYSGNNSFILGVQKDLNKIWETKYGRLYLKDLSESKNRLKIFDSEKPARNNYDETGSHTITYSRVPIYIRIDGVYFDKSFIKLGHELSHAWDWDQGKIDNFMPTKFGGLPKSEINAVRFENYLRAYDKESKMRRIYTYDGVPYQILDESSPKYYLNFKRPLRRDEIYKPLVTISNSSQTKEFGNVHIIDRMTVGLPQKPPMPQVIYNIKTNKIVKDDE